MPLRWWSGPARPTQAPRRYRPALESLEERSLLAVVAVPLPGSAPRPMRPLAAQVFANAYPQRDDALPNAPPFVLGMQGFWNPSNGRYRLDAAGVLMSYHRSAGGWYYNPTSIARFVNHMYVSWLEMSPAERAASPYLAAMRQNSDWLLHNMVSVRDPWQRSVRLYKFNFPYRGFSIPTGWTSALSASNAMIALYCTGRIFNDATLLGAANRLLNAFDLLVRDGGYRIKLRGNRAVWFEEYAHRNGTDPRVLNGHMYTLSNLAWFAAADHNNTARRLFTEGLNGLQLTLPLYNERPYSAYDLRRRGQFYHYHIAHIQLLDHLYNITGSSQLYRTARRWSRQ
jgi:hypothetical protein